jgi:hypothetical protein
MHLRVSRSKVRRQIFCINDPDFIVFEEVYANEEGVRQKNFSEALNQHVDFLLRDDIFQHVWKISQFTEDMPDDDDDEDDEDDKSSKKSKSSSSSSSSSNSNSSSSSSSSSSSRSSSPSE